MTSSLFSERPVWSRRLWWHGLGVLVFSVLVLACFLEPPGLGDDATYWRLAESAMSRGLDVFNTSGFHTLRWPVWGPAYVMNQLGGTGLPSYYIGPLFYLPLGALAAFALTWRFTARPAVAWLAVVLFIMHPLLNSICYRPMPDLSEGLFIGGAFWLWFRWMSVERIRARHWGLALGAGLFIGLAHSNRFTGLLAVPVLGLATVVLFPARRWLRLAPVLAAAAAFILAECAVFQAVTGDFWHSFHENLGARGRKGTEAVAWWKLPFRFFIPLWKGERMEPFFFLAALGGAAWCWRRGTPGHRAAVWWWVLMYLAYSCALQSLSPPRPMLRDAGRFLSSLALPMSVLGAAGIWWGLRGLGAVVPSRWRVTGPAASTAGLAVLLAVLLSGTKRPWTHAGYVPGMRAELEALPDGATVISHDHFMAIARMADYDKATALRWEDSLDMLTPGNIKIAPADADALYYCRKQMWLRRRKSLENDQEIPDRSLPWYFQRPWEHWTLSRVLLESGNSDFVFFRRRKAEDPPPQVWEGSLPPFLQAAGLTLPVAWKGDGKKAVVRYELPVPEDWRGRHLWVSVEGASNHQQPLGGVKLVWRDAEGQTILTQTETPYFHRENAHDFHALAIPAEAVAVTVTINFLPAAKWIDIKSLTFYLQSPGGD